MTNKELAFLAIEAKERAVPTYSNFHVGAAILTENDKVYLAGNVETSSYSLTLCAERISLFKAISEKEKKFKALAIASDDPDFCPPCGACRQALNDLCGDIDIVMINDKKELKIMKLSELFPFPFGDNNLK
jgi:cytidine deaminase